MQNSGNLLGINKICAFSSDFRVQIVGWSLERDAKSTPQESLCYHATTSYYFRVCLMAVSMGMASNN